MGQHDYSVKIEISRFLVVFGFGVLHSLVRSELLVVIMASNVCYDFIKGGSCARGSTCKFLHQIAAAAGAGKAKVTDAELRQICVKLWELDDNRLVPGKDYEISLQAGKSSYSGGDFAPLPLFKFVDPKALGRPSFAALLRLFDNYSRSTGTTEVVTTEEKKENWDFLNAVLQTRIMKYAHEILVSKGVAAKSMSDFARELHEIWFTLYKRETLNDSSGFEHVFVGEERDGKVMGMHNWLQIYMEEKKGNFNYKGYILPRRRARGEDEPHENEQLVTIQFEWHGKLKPVSTSFIGTSPEFEFALYTLCFLLGDEAQSVEVGPYRDVDLRCFSYGYGGRKKLGTSFPEHEMRLR